MIFVEMEESCSSTLLSNEDVDWWLKVLSDEEEKESIFEEQWKREEANEATLPTKKKNTRFSQLSETDIEEWCKPFVPKNTLSNTGWAVRNFKEWLAAFNAENSEGKRCPELLLETSDDAGILCHWLCRFVTGTRRSNGEQYTPTSVHSLLSGLYRHVKEKNPNSDDLNFMDKKNQRFKELHSVCDRLYRDLRKKGIGANPKKAELITPEDERQLWETGVLGIHSPASLLNAVFYYNGKNFHLRGGQEHRFLSVSQIQRYQNPNRYVYIETGSKNRSGGINDYKLQNKVVPIVANPEVEYCHIKLLDLYLSKNPPGHQGSFYLRPAILSSEKQDLPWFTSQPMGKNQLSKMVSNMFQKAGISGKNVTNHSLRASGTTQLYRAGAPENIIQERTGHKSLDALQLYERTSMDQHENVSKVLQKPMIPQKRAAEDLPSEVPGSSVAVTTPSEVVPLKEKNDWSRNHLHNPVPIPVPLREHSTYNPVFKQCQIMNAASIHIHVVKNNSHFDFDEFVKPYLDSLP
jgi:hypothetical protein